MSPSRIGNLPQDRQQTPPREQLSGRATSVNTEDRLHTQPNPLYTDYSQ